MSQKPGRNDPCPCGSGKKFKKCCEGKTSKRLNFSATKLDSSKVSFGHVGTKAEANTGGGYSLADRVKNLGSGTLSASSKTPSQAAPKSKEDQAKESSAENTKKENREENREEKKE